MPAASSASDAGIYVIVDADAAETHGISVSEVIRAVGLARPRLVQLRAKDRPAKLAVGWLRELRTVTRRSETLLFANDRADLARLAECDGVHVGQEDPAVSELREHFPELLVGVSTHDETQFTEALDARPDYVALGPIFTTMSKKNPEPVVGVERLTQLRFRAREAGVPVVAIGGLTERNLGEVAAVSDYQALISAIFPSEGEVTARTIAQRIALLDKRRSVPTIS